MSLLIRRLALGEQSSGEAVAKLAILLASFVSGTAGYLLLQVLPGPVVVAEAWRTRPLGESSDF
jgi:NhaA family Na+:H+ antiporter